MTAVADRLYRALLVAVTILLGVLTVVVTYQVVGRYISFIPRALWTEEISRLCLAWLVFLGAALAVRRHEHFLIDVIPARAAERIRKPLQLLVIVITALGALVLLVGGLHFAGTGAARISTTSGIRLVWAYASMPVAGLSMLVFLAELAVRTLRGEKVEEIGSSLVEADTPGIADEELGR